MESTWTSPGEMHPSEAVIGTRRGAADFPWSAARRSIAEDIQCSSKAGRARGVGVGRSINRRPQTRRLPFSSHGLVKWQWVHNKSQDSGPLVTAGSVLVLQVGHSLTQVSGSALQQFNMVEMEALEVHNFRSMRLLTPTARSSYVQLRCEVQLRYE